MSARQALARIEQDAGTNYAQPATSFDVG